MKKALLTVAVFALAAVDAEIPRPAPDIAIQLTGGKQVHVSDYRGKAVIIAFILTT